MAWLNNFNNSLSNIKGQLTTFANEVLAEEIVQEPDPNNPVCDEFEQLIATQKAEIDRLRLENEGLKCRKTVRSNEEGNDDGWSWDPPDNTENTPAIISDLKNRIAELENEKKDLVFSIEQLDQDCQQTTDKLVTIKDELQTQHNKLKLDYADLNRKNEFLSKINEENQKRIDHLESGDQIMIPHDTKVEALNKQIEELLEIKRQYEELKLKKDYLPDYNKLECILQEYETKVSECEHELTNLRSSNKILIESSEKRAASIISENMKLKHEAELIYTELQTLKSNFNEFKLLEERYYKMADEISVKDLKIKNIEAELVQNRNCTSDNDKLHSKYIQILKQIIGKYTDIQLTENNDDGTQLSQYTNMIETTVKLISDYKLKTEVLSKEISNLTEEKGKIFTEKNYEIEKLIQNSEDLSKEINMKTVDLKHYEEECAQLIKNNELLISKLDQFTNSSSNLQTISESNEDNVLVLETQLEKANKRIEELEYIVNDMENGKQESTAETQTELAYIKNQLNITGKELDVAKKQYQTLLNSYKDLETDNSSLKNKLEDMKTNYNDCYSERETLNNAVDQIQTEYENTEYKYAEQNINMETLKEEIETHLKHIDNLTSENERLQMLRVDAESKNELLEKEIEDLKQELTEELEYTESREKLSLDLKDSKLSEDGLKLQLANLNKERTDLLALKNSIEESYKIAMNDLNDSKYKLNDFIIAVAELKAINEGLLEENRLLQNKVCEQQDNFVNKENFKMEEVIAEQNNLLEQMKLQETVLKEKNELLQLCESTKNELMTVKKEFEDAVEMNKKLLKDYDEYELKIAENNHKTEEANEQNRQLVVERDELVKSRNQMIELIQEKQNENIGYHAEIQRLQQVIMIESEKCSTFEAQLQNFNVTTVSPDEIVKKDAEIEKLADQNTFLREKCAVLAENLLQEQSNVQKVIAERSNVSEREVVLQKKLDSLTQHLLDVEESYTHEVQQAELKCEEMAAKLQEVAQREKNTSNRYTSVNIRANQKMETLETQLQLVTNQRDEFKRKVSDFEDQVEKQAAALSNLQIVLQQFQRDKEKDIFNETERIKRQVVAEKNTQGTLHVEISELKNQLDESKQGLKAAVRLSEQVDASKKQVAAMKDEAHGFSMFRACRELQDVSITSGTGRFNTGTYVTLASRSQYSTFIFISTVTKLQHDLARSNEKNQRLLNQTDGKVDKMLIKNLIIGLVSSKISLTKDQNQILKIISTVLDFNQQDIEKVQLNKQQESSWFNSLLHPQTLEGQNMSQESLSQAFVKFLEAESKPRQLPNLLESTSPLISNDTKTDSSRSSSVSQSPILLNEVVLPTFADFGQARNSSSILKDVLKDNS